MRNACLASVLLAAISCGSGDSGEGAPGDFTSGSTSVEGAGVTGAGGGVTGTGAGATGAGGGATGAGGGATSASSSSASGASTGTGVGPDTGGASQGEPEICEDVSECGDFGSGCIGCASARACAEQYEACATSRTCQAHSACMGQCESDDEECARACDQRWPEGARLFDALIQCVVCGECRAPCAEISATCG